jgi:hypothetical protein
MSLISTRLHGVIDYVFGLVLVGWAVMGELPGSQRAVIVALAAVAFAYSLATRYELGLFRLIGFNTHLVLDVAVGVLLFALPYLLGLPDDQQFIAYGLGLVSFVVVALSEKRVASATGDA